MSEEIAELTTAKFVLALCRELGNEFGPIHSELEIVEAAKTAVLARELRRICLEIEGLGEIYESYR